MACDTVSRGPDRVIGISCRTAPAGSLFDDDGSRAPEPESAESKYSEAHQHLLHITDATIFKSS